MKPSYLALASLTSLLLTGVAAADDTGGFVVKLGRDTTSAERYTRTPTRLEVHQVGRTPRVMRRLFTYEYAPDGSLKSMSMAVTPTGSATPSQTVQATVGDDSLRVNIQSGAAAQTIAVGAVPGVVIVPLSSPWAPYEGETMKLARGKADTLRSNVYFLGARTQDWMRLRRLGRDSVELTNSHDDVYHLRVDASGRIQGVLPISGTGMFSAQRQARVDVDALTASFVAREKAGAGVGQLSPRDTVSATAGGASLWVDYSRPSKRGRVIFGNVVPYGAVWRTGANAATQFRTDKALDFGGTVVPAGTYTLWTVPTATGWKLIVNSETGQWGTEHKPEKDLATIDMKTTKLPQAVERFTISLDPGADGGVIHLDWDTTRASAAFKTQP